MIARKTGHISYALAVSNLSCFPVALSPMASPMEYCTAVDDASCSESHPFLFSPAGRDLSGKRVGPGRGGVLFSDQGNFSRVWLPGEIHFTTLLDARLFFSGLRIIYQAQTPRNAPLKRFGKQLRIRQRKQTTFNGVLQKPSRLRKRNLALLQSHTPFPTCVRRTFFCH